MPGAQHGAGGIRTQARAAVTAPGRGPEAPRRPPPAQDSGRFGVRVCVRTDRPVLQYAKKKKKSNRRVSGRPGYSGAYGHGPDSSPPAGRTSRRRGRARPEARSKKPRNKRGGDWPGCRDSDGAPALGARGARGADFALGSGSRAPRAQGGAGAVRRRGTPVCLPPCPWSCAAPFRRSRPAAARLGRRHRRHRRPGSSRLASAGLAPDPGLLQSLIAFICRRQPPAGNRRLGLLQTKACSSPAGPRAD